MMDIENSNDELQSNDDLIEQDFDLDDGADLDENRGADLATDSDPEHDKISEDDADDKPVNQEAFNSAIAKQHAKYREEQRKRQALEEEVNKLRGGQSSSGDPEPKIPEVDQYADDLAEQLKERDEAIRAHMAWQERDRQRQSQSSQYEEKTRAEQQQEQEQAVERFFDRAKKNRINQNDLNQAISTVGQYQLGQDVAQYLMSDDKGDQMTMAISKKPALLAELSMMTPTERILHLERNVRSRLKAGARQTKAKPPPKRVAGRASGQADKYPLTGGKVKIE